LQRGRIAAVAVLAVLLGGCATGRGASSDDASTTADRRMPSPDHLDDAPFEVRVEDGAIVLDDRWAGERSEVRLGAAEGEVLGAVLRPGDHAETTVLVLTRVRDRDRSPRFELRYLVASGDAVSELLWLPWRQQVDPTAAALLDVPTLPVWSPDGSTVAWIEWSSDGTRLRTIAWDDAGLLAAPAATEDGIYALRGVPAGAQLEAWHDGEDGVPVLVGRLGDERYRIRLDLAPAVPVTGAGSA
jgi:predicted small secreted protein